jgi:hypothetical protein
LSSKNLQSSSGGSHKGGLPLLWGEPPVCGGVGGTRPPPLSLGETGKGNPKIPSLLPQAVVYALRSSSSLRYRRLALLPSALWLEQTCSGAIWCPQSSNGRCYLSSELKVSPEGKTSFRRKRAVTRTRRFAIKPKFLGCLLFHGRRLARLTIPQRLVSFATHP